MNDIEKTKKEFLATIENYTVEDNKSNDDLRDVNIEGLINTVLKKHRDVTFFQSAIGDNIRNEFNIPCNETAIAFLEGIGDSKGLFKKKVPVIIFTDKAIYGRKRENVTKTEVTYKEICQYLPGANGASLVNIKSTITIYYSVAFGDIFSSSSSFPSIVLDFQNELMKKSINAKRDFRLLLKNLLFDLCNDYFELRAYVSKEKDNINHLLSALKYVFKSEEYRNLVIPFFADMSVCFLSTSNIEFAFDNLIQDPDYLDEFLNDVKMALAKYPAIHLQELLSDKTIFDMVWKRTGFSILPDKKSWNEYIYYFNHRYNEYIQTLKGHYSRYNPSDDLNILKDKYGEVLTKDAIQYIKRNRSKGQNRVMLDIIELVKKEQSVTTKERYKDSLGLSGLDYAILLGKHKIIRQTLKEFKIGFPLFIDLSQQESIDHAVVALFAGHSEYVSDLAQCSPDYKDCKRAIAKGKFDIAIGKIQNACYEFREVKDRVEKNAENHLKEIARKNNLPPDALIKRIKRGESDDSQEYQDNNYDELVPFDEEENLDDYNEFLLEEERNIQDPLSIIVEQFIAEVNEEYKKLLTSGSKKAKALQRYASNGNEIEKYLWTHL